MTEMSEQSSETEDEQNGKAPTVYLDDGTPVKVRLAAYECIGQVGEGMFGYDGEGGHQTVFFEEVDDGRE